MKKTGWITFAALAAVCAFTLLACEPDPGYTTGSTKILVDLSTGTLPNGYDYKIIYEGSDDKDSILITMQESYDERYRFEIYSKSNPSNGEIIGYGTSVKLERLYRQYSGNRFTWALSPSGSIGRFIVDTNGSKDEFSEDGDKWYRLSFDKDLTPQEVKQISEFGQITVKVTNTDFDKTVYSLEIPAEFASYVKTRLLR